MKYILIVPFIALFLGGCFSPYSIRIDDLKTGDVSYVRMRDRYEEIVGISATDGIFSTIRVNTGYIEATTRDVNGSIISVGKYPVAGASFNKSSIDYNSEMKLAVINLINSKIAVIDLANDTFNEFEYIKNGLIVSWSIRLLDVNHFIMFYDFVYNDSMGTEDKEGGHQVSVISNDGDYCMLDELGSRFYSWQVDYSRNGVFYVVNEGDVLPSRLMFIPLDDIEKATPSKILDLPFSSSAAIACSPDGKFALVRDSQIIGKEADGYFQHSDQFYLINVDDREIKKIKFQEFDAGEYCLSLQWIENNYVGLLCITNDSPNRVLRIYDLNTGKVVKEIRDSMLSPYGVLGDGRYLISNVRSFGFHIPFFPSNCKD